MDRDVPERNEGKAAFRQAVVQLARLSAFRAKHLAVFSWFYLRNENLSRLVLLQTAGGVNNRAIDAHD